MKAARMNVEKIVRVCPVAQACQACQAIMPLSCSFFSISVRDLQAMDPTSTPHTPLSRLHFAHYRSQAALCIHTVAYQK